MTDLTLPESSSPTMDRFRNMPGALLPIAVYTHVELDQAEVDEVLRVCNSKHEPETVVAAPQFNLAGQPLRAAYDLHIGTIAPARELDPFYFVSIVDKQWRSKGVVLVTLDTYEDEDSCTVDQVIMPAKETALTLVNLQIANMDWEDVKEGGWSDDEEDDAPSSQPAATAKDEDDFDDGAATEPPSMGYWVGFYSIDGVEYETVMRDLDPAPVQRSLEDLELRPEGRVSTVEEAARLHPLRCARNSLLCRDMFLMVDSPQYQEKGLLFVRLSEEGIKTRRLPYERHETLTRFNMVVQGHSQFDSGPAFLVYDCGAASFESTLRFLDKKKDTEKFIQVDVANNGSASTLDQVLKMHVEMVYRHRFDSILPRYLVFTQEKLESASQAVTLVKTEWTGDAESMTLEERRGEKTPDGMLNVKTLSCAASKAYITLLDLVEGRQDLFVAA